MVVTQMAYLIAVEAKSWSRLQWYGDIWTEGWSLSLDSRRVSIGAGNKTTLPQTTVLCLLLMWSLMQSRDLCWKLHEGCSKQTIKAVGEFLTQVPKHSPKAVWRVLNNFETSIINIHLNPWLEPAGSKTCSYACSDYPFYKALQRCWDSMGSSVCNIWVNLSWSETS